MEVRQGIAVDLVVELVGPQASIDGLGNVIDRIPEGATLVARELEGFIDVTFRDDHDVAANRRP
jgi:hypothetical protein